MMGKKIANKKNDKNPLRPNENKNDFHFAITGKVRVQKQ
jgi:hypothetical protein